MRFLLLFSFIFIQGCTQQVQVLSRSSPFTMKKIASFSDGTEVCGVAFYERFGTGFLGADRDWRFIHSVMITDKGCPSKGTISATTISIANVRNGSVRVSNGRQCSAASICPLEFEIDDRRGGGTCSDVTVEYAGEEIKTELCGTEQRRIQRPVQREPSVGDEWLL